MSSEDRTADLCRLFRCRFATGRAAGAPSLKRIGLDEKLLAVDMVYAKRGAFLEQDGFLYPVGDYEGTIVPEAYLHDASQLPHLIGGDLRLLFPRAVPAEERDELAEEADWLEERATAARLPVREAGGCETIPGVGPDAKGGYYGLAEEQGFVDC